MKIVLKPRDLTFCSNITFSRCVDDKDRAVSTALSGFLTSALGIYHRTVKLLSCVIINHLTYILVYNIPLSAIMYCCQEHYLLTQIQDHFV